MPMDLQRIEIKNPTGISTDPKPSDLPTNKWSFGNNVKFRNGKATMVEGYSSVYDVPPEPLLFAMPYLSQNTPFWIGGSETKLRITTGSGGWIDYSRTAGGPYAATQENNWNGGFLSGVAVLNNRFDVPQSLLPSANSFIDLPNWPADYRAKVVRPFKNYLVALNITANSVDYPNTVKWSAPADPGEVPSTWDITDPTNDAGEAPLADTPGAIVDGKKLRDVFVIYKEDSVYSMRYVGGTFVFQFQQLFDDVGVLATNCAAEFDGKHFVVGRGDVYVHNGVQKSSVIDGDMKDLLFSSISAQSISTTFVVPDYSNTEMWICFAQSATATDQGFCDKACVWNWTTDEWSLRDLPDLIGASSGVVDPQDPDFWDSDPDEWDSDATVWGSQTYNPSKNKVVLVSYARNRVYVVGESNRFDGENFTSYLERSDIYFDDDLKMKSLTSVTPHISGLGVAKIWIGTNNIQDAPVLWNGPYLYNIGVDHHINCRHFGRYIGIRIEFSSEKAWALNGYTLEFTPMAGKR